MHSILTFIAHKNQPSIHVNIWAPCMKPWVKKSQIFLKAESHSACLVTIFWGDGEKSHPLSQRLLSQTWPTQRFFLGIKKGSSLLNHRLVASALGRIWCFSRRIRSKWEGEVEPIRFSKKEILSLVGAWFCLRWLDKNKHYSTKWWFYGDSLW